MQTETITRYTSIHKWPSPVGTPQCLMVQSCSTPNMRVTSRVFIHFLMFKSKSMKSPEITLKIYSITIKIHSHLIQFPLKSPLSLVTVQGQHLDFRAWEATSTSRKEPSRFSATSSMDFLGSVMTMRAGWWFQPLWKWWFSGGWMVCS